MTRSGTRGGIFACRVAPAAILLGLTLPLTPGTVPAGADGAGGASAPAARSTATETREKLQARLDQVKKRAPGSEEEAEALADLAAADQSAGDLQPAAAGLEAAIALRSRLAPSHESLFDWERRLAGVYLRLDSLASAETHFTKALERCPDKAVDRVNVLEGLGRTQAQRSDWEHAIGTYLQALELRRSTVPDPRREILDCLDVAAAEDELGRLAEADRYLAQAQAIRGAARPDLAASILVGRGIVAQHRWHLDDALQLFREAASLLREPGSSPQQLADALMHVSWMERQTGDLTGAWRDVSTALELLEKHQPGSPEYGHGLESAGDIARLRGDRQAAMLLTEKALVVQERWNPKSRILAGLCINRGNLSLSENPVLARSFYEKARVLMEEQSPSSYALGTIHFNVSVSYFNEGRTEKALEEIDQAIQVYERTSPQSARMANALSVRAECLDELHRVSEAGDLFQRSLAMWTRVAPTSPTRVTCIYHYAEHLHQIQDLKGAVRVAEEAWSLWQRISREAGNDEARQAVSAVRMRQAGELVRLLTEDGQAQRALQVLEEARALALWRSLQDSRTRPAGVPDERWEAYTTAREARKAANARLANAGDTVARLEAARGKDGALPEPAELTRAREALRDARQEQIQARLRVDGLWTQLLQGLPGETSAPDFAASMRAVDQARSAGTTAVEFLVGPKETLLFLLEAAPASGASPQLRVFHLPVTDKELLERVRELTRSLREARSNGPDLSRRLAGLLFPPEAAAGLRSGRRLVIVPDGPLWELPFAALRLSGSSAKGGSYLGFEKPLTTVHSLAFFARDLARQPATKLLTPPRVLAVGDPTFALPEVKVAANPRGVREVGSPLPAPAPLPGTRQDATGVARLYGVAPVLGSDATEVTVRKRMESADIVHLATHGYVHPYWPGASRIYLAFDPAGQGRAGSVDASNDGVLEAWEIGNQLHMHADLVVLAACETNGGSVVGGEGIDGLVRSLLRAGAHSVVASHWQVQDDGTRELMLTFHRGVRNGLPKDEALRQAMVKVARHPGWEHPYYWASFALTGDRENHLFGR